MSEFKIPKKLIEVALPLDDINDACAYEKQPGIGAHPRGLHYWWARRPLAAARAVIFAQLVNDPGYERQLGRGMNKDKAALERERLFEIIRKLVLWENINNEDVINEAREEILRSWRETCELNKNHPDANELFDPEKLPSFHDPFAGGGALPLEALRLGLNSTATDINPVAVLINKSMIEIPHRFAGVHPVGPAISNDKQIEMCKEWIGLTGLSEDVRRYGNWIREAAKERIGHLYPQIRITKELAENRPDLVQYIGRELKVLTWIWTRTVKSPNPAFSHVDVPLISNFKLATKAKKNAWIEPIIEGEAYRFTVRTNGTPKILETVNRKGAICLLSGTPISFKYIRDEAKSGRLGSRLMAIIADGPTGRIYLPPTSEVEEIAKIDAPNDIPETVLPEKALGFRVQEYGITKWRDLFNSRQLWAMKTFADLVNEVRGKIYVDSIESGMINDGISLSSGGYGATAYSEAVSTYLALAISRMADYNCTISTWKPSGEQVMHTFTRHAIQMTWDYSESNVLIDKGICWANGIKYTAESIEKIGSQIHSGAASQKEAQTLQFNYRPIISTDPPYYDNIGYSDLSDFFYIWLRLTMKGVYPELFSTITVPKMDELVATEFRHGSKENAESFFLNGMTNVMKNLSECAHPAFPVTIYYAFKQSETKQLGTVSTGWETFLEAVIQSGFVIAGTWPMRTELSSRVRAGGSNALASSIVLVCKKRENNADTVSRREFIRKLNEILPGALYDMTQGGVNSPVAPVDLSQAIIGPGMAIFSQYCAVLEADGNPMTVHSALALINRFLSEDDFDLDTQFCLHWFESFGWNVGQYGQAETMSKAKGIGINGLVESGVIESGGGSVRLFRWSEYPADWNPQNDTRISVWEALHQLIRALNTQGEQQTSELLALMASKSDSIRALAYRLYTLCERKGWADDARYYNEIMTAWDSVEKLSRETAAANHSTAQIEFDL